MKNLVRQWIMAIGVFFLFYSTLHAKVSDNYSLVWAEEFTANGKLNPSHWTFEKGFVRNKELQWYQKENAYCRNGVLILEARKVQRKNPLYVKGNRQWRKKRAFIQFTSASVTTKKHHSWKYGRFVIRAKIQTDKGLWPAIWFVGEKGKWPHRGEVDLMEYYRGTLLANACWGSKQEGKPRWDRNKFPLSSLGDRDWDKKFHIWRMDWNEKEIKLYVDNKLLNSIDVEKARNPKNKLPLYPFKQPFFLRLNLAVGSNGGNPNGTEFPAKMEVDYIRIYQKLKK